MITNERRQEVILKLSNIIDVGIRITRETCQRPDYLKGKFVYTTMNSRNCVGRVKCVTNNAIQAVLAFFPNMSNNKIQVQEVGLNWVMHKKKHVKFIKDVLREFGVAKEFGL